MHVPQDVLIEIFIRLPIESLLRFRSVCKFFHNIISSLSFTSHHIDNAKYNRIPVVRYLTTQEKERYLLLPNNMHHMQEIDFPSNAKESYKQLSMVGSSNGLLCLTNWYDIILWNPSIKKYRSLPKPRVTSTPTAVDLGFGFDCKTNDYKVVRIEFPTSENMEPQVEIYTVKSGSWRNFNAGAPLPYGIHNWFGNSQSFVEGCVHWVGYSTILGKNHNLIVSFDISNEEFKEINLPDYLQQLGPDVFSTVLGERLAVYHSPESHIFMVWVMEEYGVVESWRKMFDVQMANEVLTFVGFTDNGDVLIQAGNRDLEFYDPNNKSITCVGVPSGDHEGFHMEMYMESLVLLNGESAIMPSEATTCGDELWSSWTQILILK